MTGPDDLRALAEAIARAAAGPHEVRVLLQGDLQSEAYRNGWAWTDGLDRMLRIQEDLGVPGAVLAWEGGACALVPGVRLPPALAPAPGTAGRARCPGLGTLPEILASPGPDLAEIPEDAPLALASPDADASGHARLAWRRHLGDTPPAILRHPDLQDGAVLRRRGPLVGAFRPGRPWPLALRRLDR